MKDRMNAARPSGPIRCDVWIVKRMRYRPTNQPIDKRIHPVIDYRGALSHLKLENLSETKKNSAKQDEKEKERMRKNRVI